MLSSDAARRYRLSESEEWRKLLRLFELGDGFAFVVLTAPDRLGLAACESSLAHFLSARGQSLAVLTTDPEEIHTLPERLLSLERAPACGAVWITAAEDGDSERAAWRHAAAALNQQRNLVVRRIGVPLIWAGGPWLQVVLREMAPDLWSVRTMVVVIEPVRAPLGEPAEQRRPEPLETVEEAPDPGLALEAAERLRGKPGRERQLADLLARAARGLAARGDTAGALVRLDEAAALFAGGVGADDREALESAAEVEALAGRLQVVLGSTAEAGRRFRQALSMREGLVGRYPDHFDLWWALAASYTDMGDLMKALGEGEPARQYFEQALQIRQKLVSQEPGRADYRIDLVKSLARTGNLSNLKKAEELLLGLGDVPEKARLLGAIRALQETAKATGAG
ncbi:MAG: tetratricopeptide repeat protein [Bryobacteraceae bacterium]|nr:tetratricopeptide repeat protein [Bryobacteraceae bacterium]